MDAIAEADQSVTPVADGLVRTKIEPVTFRGVDCAELARRYADYRRSAGLDIVRQDPDVIRPLPPSGSIAPQPAASP